MPWWFVGRGTKLMVFDHNEPAYVAFWQKTLDNARRLTQQPPTITPAHLSPTVAETRELGGLPNFDLFAQFIGNANVTTALVFVFALAPFKLVSTDAQLLAHAEKTTAIGTARPAAWSMPTPSQSLQYRALVVRMTYLCYLIDLLRRRINDKQNNTETLNRCRRLERAACLWRDAHIMLSLALDELEIGRASCRERVSSPV